MQHPERAKLALWHAQVRMPPPMEATVQRRTHSVECGEVRLVVAAQEISEALRREQFRVERAVFVRPLIPST